MARLSLPRLPLFTALCAALASAALLTGCPQSPVNTRPQASFTAAPRTGNVPLTVTFQDTSTFKGTPIASWLWNFGDGTYSSAPNPVHVYNVAGDYTVSLTVTAASGIDTKSVPGFVKATERSGFATIGANGGAVSATGALLTVPAGALAKDTVFGVGRDDNAFQPNAFESITVLSPAYRITRSGDVDIIYATAAGGGFTPASIEIRFETQGIPLSDLNSDHVLVLAQLPNGETIPLASTLQGDRVHADVLRLPASARYAAVYRPGAFSVDVSNGKVLTDGDWAGGWRVFLSSEILQQLTALRVGTLQNTVPYLRRDYSASETSQTLAQLVASVGSIQSALGASGMRPPVLLNNNDRFNIVLYDLRADYTSDYGDFGSVVYRDGSFGNVVVDPRQLISIATHNASALKADPENVDIGQELGAANAIWQEVFDASFLGYGYPSFQTGFGSIEGPVNFVDALGKGLSTMIGQSADLLSTSRTFGENEVALLSQPLLSPFDSALPGYAVSGQDFFLYVNNRFNLNGGLHHIAGRDTDPAGVLEEVRKEFDKPIIGVPPTADEALLRTYQAMNRSFTKLLSNNKLSQIYWLYARDRAVENSTDAQLRPSDADRPANTLNDAIFGLGSSIVKTFDAPTDTIEAGGIEDTGLIDIPPLSSRVVIFQLRPQASEVTLTFNRADWATDALGGTVNVKVYKSGSPGQELAANRNAITVRGFTEDPENCYTKVIVLISNVNLVESNSVTISASSFSGLAGSESTVLDDYVSACDPDYSWELLASARNPVLGVTVSSLRMTTSAWRGLGDVDQTKWQHYLTIVEPDSVKSDTALLAINGGSTGNNPGAPPDGLLPFALAANTVVALLYAVPNEPITFDGETDSRTEDEIIAKSYGEYLDSYESRRTDITWPVLLPMVRSAARAMDTVQDFMANNGRVRRNIKDFVVAGASKRGWTTWLTAATDQRVRAIVPIVIDVLNMDEQMQHQLKSYGFYAPAVQAYVTEDVFDRLGTPEGTSLLKIVDPISYIDRLKMPKFIANSTGDQFFLPDSSQFYYDQLPGDNTLYYAPNTDHGLGGNIDQVDNSTGKAILAWYLSLIKGIPLPHYQWTYDDTNIISVTSDVVPSSVKLWQATNPTARDFRLETIGPRWTSTPLTLADGKFTGMIDIPAKGWSAYFVQLTWGNPIESVDAQFSASTPVRVIPDVYPVPVTP